jgi:hypothetical protein
VPIRARYRVPACARILASARAVILVPAHAGVRMPAWARMLASAHVGLGAPVRGGPLTLNRGGFRATACAPLLAPARAMR